MQQKNEVANVLKKIPKFSFKTLQRTNFTNTNLKPNTPTVFINFNTECDYCQYEAKSIGKNLEQFKGTQLLFVSTEDIDIIKAFAKKYNLLNRPNITFLNDHTHSFSTRFDATSIPYVLIYNGKQELIKKHKGQLKAGTILKLLKE